MSLKFNKNQIERFSRQIILKDIGVVGQKKILESKVLMIGMAGSGLGQGYYGETAEDLADPFREEFDLLLNTVANNLRLKVDAPGFVEFKLLNNFRQNQDGWSMPDIAAGGEGWALFKLKINQYHSRIRKKLGK